MLSRTLFPVLAAAAAAGACQDAPQVAPSGETQVTVTTVARGLDHPWSLAFLPDGRMLVTERDGRLRYVTREGALSDPIAGVPAVYAEGQGGLLDVVLDPSFAENSTIYLSYAEPAQRRYERHRRGTRAARRRRAGRCEGHIPAAAEVQEQPPFRLAPRFRARRQPLRNDRRAQFAARQGPGPRHAHRQDPAHHDGRRRAGRQPVRRPRRRPARDLVLRSPQRAGRGAAPGVGTALGNTSMARAAATRSTCRKPGRTTVGP